MYLSHALDKMNIAVFIIVMTTLALVDGTKPPCLTDTNLNPHDRFLCRHVLQESIGDKTDRAAWTT